MLGLILALVAGILFRASAAVFGRFKGREVERALAAGVLFSLGETASGAVEAGGAEDDPVTVNPTLTVCDPPTSAVTVNDPE